MVAVPVQKHPRELAWAWFGVLCILRWGWCVMEKRALHSPDLTVRNIERIADLFPNVMTEAHDIDGDLVRSIDFDLLRQELSDHIVEGPRERYQLDWPGKRAAAFAANAPIGKTLRPVREESVDFDMTKNLFIEGDNLDALKMLQESYLGKVKLIYIDPPYNTGNDFVYADDFVASTADYLAKSEQVSAAGERLEANSESNGRFHSDWLSMMYPRLKLARNLLRDDGILAISIDENELANLIAICNEILGSSCYMTTLVWRSRTGSNDPGVSVSTDHEYVVVYGRGEGARLAGVRKEFTNYSNPDNDPRGPWMADNLTCNKTRAERPNLDYPILDPNTGISYEANPNRVWAYEPKRMAELVREGRVLFSSDGSKRPALKRFQADLRSNMRPLSSLIDVPLGSAGTREVKNLFDGENLFSHPKGVQLMKLLISQATTGDEIVLDFFAGSGTTGHAVHECNADDGGSRRFILVQLPEDLGDSTRAGQLGYANVAELSRMRLKRVSKHLSFRTLRVDSSNKAEVRIATEDIRQEQLSAFESSIKPDRTGEDLLFQVLLDWGLELSSAIVSEAIDSREIFDVDDGALIACFAESVTLAVVRTLAERGPLRVVFRDDAFESDAARINAEQIFKEISPITEVRTI